MRSRATGALGAMTVLLACSRQDDLANFGPAPHGTVVTPYWYGPGNQVLGYQTKAVPADQERMRFMQSSTLDWPEGAYRAETWIGDYKLNESTSTSLPKTRVEMAERRRNSRSTSRFQLAAIPTADFMAPHRRALAGTENQL